MQSKRCHRVILALSFLWVAWVAAAVWGQPSLPPRVAGAAPLLSRYAPGRLIVKLEPAAAAALSRGGPAAQNLPPSLRTALTEHRVQRARPLFPHLRPEAGGRGAAGQAAQVRAAFPRRAQRAQSGIPIPDLENIFLVDIPADDDPRAVAAALKKDPAVIYAETDVILHTTAVPDDPYYSSTGSWGQGYPDMWGLQKIDADAAWEVTTGSDSVTIAVVDTGVDATHPDLAGRLVAGWNFVNDTDVPTDDNGHGTHVSGTIAAATDNGLGVAGLCWQGKIMPLKALDDTGSGSVSDLAQAMTYATDHGADVVNNSWGGIGSSQTLQDTVDYAYWSGCIVVASAGNSDNDAKFYVPAGLRNVVSVAATDWTDTRASSSNYSAIVDISAPGVDILSLRAIGTSFGTPVGTQYARADGTSMACAHVTGALALLIAAHPTWPTAEVIGQLLGTADNTDAANPDYVGRLGTGRVNLARSLSGETPTRRIRLISHSVDDWLGNHSGQADPGDRVRLAVTLKQFAGDSPGLTATLTTDDPAVSMVRDTLSFGNVSGWLTVDNSLNPFVFDIASSCLQGHRIHFTLTISTPGYTHTESITLMVAEAVAEAWRGGYGDATRVSVNTTDGSCWVADSGNGQVVHIAEDGTVLSRTGGFRAPYSVSVNSAPPDPQRPELGGSCWVADTDNSQIVHLAEDGTELRRIEGFLGPVSVSAYPTDGSCWVADTYHSQVVHLQADGTELRRIEGFNLPISVSVNSAAPDPLHPELGGSCWVADFGNNQVVHLAEDGTELRRIGGFNFPASVSVNSAAPDPLHPELGAACWVADSENNQVVLLLADGTERRYDGFYHLWSVSVDPTDGSCWVADSGNDQVVHLWANGTETRYDGFHSPQSVSVNHTNSSCWVADGPVVVHLAEDGTEVSRTGGFTAPYSVSVNSAAPDPLHPELGGSCWLADPGNNQVAHLAADGTELRRKEGFNFPASVSVNSAAPDPLHPELGGSCWVADSENNQVFHLWADGTERRYDVFYSPQSVSVDPTDGSCWVADTYDHQVVHLAENGTELWRGGGFSYPQSVSVNPADGSCWVADWGHGQVVHLSASGDELWRGREFLGPCSVSVNPADGSCWVADYDLWHVVHLAEDGTELWRGGGFYEPSSVSANPTDGSCWVADTGYGQIVHLGEDGTELWRRGGIDVSGEHYFWFYRPYSVSVNPTDGSCWVADTGHSQVVHLDAHAVVVTASATPAVVDSGGATSLSASAFDYHGHSIAVGSWQWSDDGAGGTFPPSATSQNPTYTAPENATAGDLMVTLSATAICDGPEAVSGSGTIILAVHPVAHTFSVTAGTPSPATVASGAGTTLAATATDSRSGHPVTWSWDDGGAGGIFSPSSTVQSPIYTAPANTSDGDLTILLTISASCSGGGSDTDPTTLTVNPVSHTFSVTAGAPSPGAVASGGTTSLSASATDSRPGHTVSAWQWDDGGAGGMFSPSSSAQNPSYTAPSNTTGNDLPVTLTVHATCDGSVPASGSDAAVLTVHSAAVGEADFSGAPTRGKLPLAVDFRDLSTNAPTSWAWEFGDGGSSTEQNPSHAYLAAGVYTVSLTVSGAGGADTESKSGYVTVSFADVEITPVDSSDHWALNYILACVNAGIVTGYADGTYWPLLPVSRDAMAVYISRALAGGDDNVPPDSAYPTPSFADVDSDNWAYNYIEYAAEQNVVQGYDDGSYHPQEVVIRDQMAVYVARSMVAPNGEAGLADYVPSDPRDFPDVPADFWARKHIEYCVEHGVVNGYDDGLYHPEWVVTRDQMAVYVARAFQLPL